MKHFNLKGFALATSLMIGGLSADAQVYHPLAFPAVNGGVDNFYSNYVGLRFTISNPVLDVAYTVANDGSGGTGEWGGAVTGTFTGSIVKAIDSLACTSLSNAGAISGNIALVYRGDCEFGMKAFQAQTAGATACIIVNNISGGPVGMGPGSMGAQVTIPVFMISKEDGDMLNAVLNNSQTSTATIVPWSSGTPNEVAIIKGGSALWSNYAIPKHQLGTNNGNPAAYKMQPGAYIANFGANAQTNVRYDSKIMWTPTGGATTTFASDDFTTPTFTVADSIIAIYTDQTPDLHATTTGRFDIIDSISSDADGIAGNNVVKNSVYVTDRVFCKSRYDFTKNQPMSNIGFRRGGSGGPASWGPLFYVAKGGYNLEKLQFSISNNTVGPMSLLTQLMVVLKWQDGSNGGPLDGFIDNSEVSLVASATRDYTGTTADSSGHFVTVDIDGGPVLLEDNTWYWVIADLQDGFFLGCDGVLNYLPRTVLYNVNVPALSYEQYAPFYPDEYSVLQSNNDGVFPVPFEGVDMDSLRFSNQKQGIVPSIAMITSLFPASVENTQTANALGHIKLAPNPATDKLTVTLDLAQKADKATVRVMSVLGQIITRNEMQEVKNNTFDINTSDYAPGNYYVLISVGERTMFEKFTVVTK